MIYASVMASIKRSIAYIYSVVCRLCWFAFSLTELTFIDYVDRCIVISILGIASSIASSHSKLLWPSHIFISIIYVDHGPHIYMDHFFL